MLNRVSSYVSRTTKDTSISGFLSSDEWKILYINFNPSRKIQKYPSSLIKLTIWIAQLGGFLARNGDGPPGITHMWRGLEKLSDMVLGMRLHSNICG